MATPEEAGTSDLFASPEELAAKSQGQIDANDPDTIRELASATDLIRTAARWHISPQRVDTVRLNAVGDILMLPTLRLVNLVSVTDDGTTVDPDTLDYGLDDAGDGIILGRRWTRRRGRVVATFQHGYADVPAALAGLCLQIAARALGSPLGVVREQTLSSSVTYSLTAPGVAGGSAILEHEQAIIDPYRRPI